MDQQTLRARAIALYDDFTHVHLDRRRFFTELTKLTGGVAAAQALAMTIAADPAAAAIVADNDPRIWSRVATLDRSQRPSGYLALPADAMAHFAAHKGKLGYVLVIHENRGLQPYTRDVARRLAVAGFGALAIDLLSPYSGTPPDEDKARQEIAQLNLQAAAANCLDAVSWLRQGALCNGKVGVVGFCWGGAMVNRLAVAAGNAINAAVAFYGPTPDPAEAAKVKVPMLLHYAGNDARVDEGAKAWVPALKAAHVDVTSFTYPGVEHAFHNDTAAARYNKPAAELAWSRTIAFLREKLA